MKAIVLIACLAVAGSFAVPLGTTMAVDEEEPLKRISKCNLCKKFVEKLTEAIVDNPDDVKKVAEVICDMLTHGIPPFDGWCKRWVDKELDKVIANIHDHVTPEGTCQRIDAC